MDFKNLSQFEGDGFIGFKTMEELFSDHRSIPKVKGVYLVLNLQRRQPSFLIKGSGGHFKGRDPNVSTSMLEDNWVKSVLTIYIGKAGGISNNATLHSRIGQYLQFGQGRNVGHWGGRYIWQLVHCRNLLVCWKPLPDDDPRMVEESLLSLFIAQYGRLPFANLSQ